jgi:hypothetical protein
MAIAALLALIAGLLLAFYAWRAPRRIAEAQRAREGAPLQATTAWTNEAGAEFAGLSEAARCDLVFAVAALDDERSQKLLEHALAGHGRQALVEAYLSSHPGARADRIAQALALLD